MTLPPTANRPSASNSPIGALPRERADLEVVASLVRERSRVLDLGCGDGALLRLLVDSKGVTARGVEITYEGVLSCIAQGIPVDHSDLDRGLGDYPDQSFDYVILSQTLQAVHKPDLVVREMLRVGRVGIVSFPNFGYWYVRLRMLTSGRMPKSDYLPYEWYDTPNIHLCTVTDFTDLCRVQGIAVDEALFLSDGQRIRRLPNLMAKTAIFVVRRP
jgi:methionine biosynthesis protein MetW